jgi:hypothetical protein
LNRLHSLLQVPRRLVRGVLRRLPGRQGASSPAAISYPHWIAERVRQRCAAYPAAPVQGLFSVLTSVYNTPPAFLWAMAESVLGQDYPWFEWVVVDNGSTAAATRTVLERLRQDGRVRLLRLETNRGILGGMRVAFEQARGRYVLPVDSDDLLYLDALRVLAHCLRTHGYPAAAYSDEDKLSPDGLPCRPFFKPDWDPVLFLNCCYVAHLGAIDREAAAAVGAYTDDAAHGCHDWDTFFRLRRAGHTPMHVPEVLYSWRMHPDSTASDTAGAKPFTTDCQYDVLSRHLELLGAADRFEIRSNPFFRGVGLWHVARRHRPPVPPVHVLLLAGADRDRRRQVLHALAQCNYPDLEVYLIGLTRPISNRYGRVLRVRQLAGTGVQSPVVRHWLGTLPAEALVAVLDDDLMPLTADWPWEALGLLELHPETAVVGGRVLDAQGVVQSAGEVFGVDGLLGCPVRGRKEGEYGPYGTLICQRAVGAVASGFCVTRAGFLADLLAQRDGYLGRGLLGAWLGAAARRQGLRVVYSPHLVAQAGSGCRPLRSAEEEWEFLQQHWPLLLDDPTYARFLSLESSDGYELATPAERAAVLNPTLCRLAGLFPTDRRPTVDDRQYLWGARPSSHQPARATSKDLLPGEEYETRSSLRVAHRQLDPALPGTGDPAARA